MIAYLAVLFLIVAVMGALLGWAVGSLPRSDADLWADRNGPHRP